MKPLETLHVGDFLVNLGIVLHRAAPERIESGVDTEVHLRQVGVVPNHIHLAHLRQLRSLRTHQILRDSGGRKSTIGK